MAEVVGPTLRQMADDGHPYTGFLYAGLILAPRGPQVLEFNVRLGDPETQVVLPRMETDIVDLIEGALNGGLVEPTWSDQAAVEIVLAADGYPEAPVKGTVITGIDRLPDDVIVFHAGTAREGKNLVVDGGRVLNLVAVGDTVAAARDRVYDTVETVRWRGMQYRRDIGGDPT
jgi:phosphoribosylamine--glycine ligase